MAKTTTKTLPIRERIRAANTDLVDAQALRERLLGWNPQRTENVDDQYRARLTAGADPATLLDDYIEAKGRENLAGQFGLIVRDVLQRVTDQRDYERAFVDTALDMCRDELDTIMARVDSNRDLIARHETAETAARNGDLEAWQTVEGLLDDYDQLTAEYRRQIRLADSSLHGPLIGSAQCRDFLDVSSYWMHQRRVTSILEDYPDHTIRAWFRGLPNTGGHSRAEWILTVADHQPWMPDADELRQATTIAEQLCRHRWNSGNAGADRQFFAANMANLRHITHDEPLPEQKPRARRVA
ncbi:hypothetical protein [Gordonia sp. MP11Mi]|uniref:Uncharacterized protein n=1 Tax=Gordonia sp. MP11Mi TaxID=3022769 RepID=A0AA97GVF7_9ACTN